MANLPFVWEQENSVNPSRHCDISAPMAGIFSPFQPQLLVFVAQSWTGAHFLYFKRGALSIAC